MSRGSLQPFSSDSVDWAAVRDCFPLRTDMIYLNCGTEGSMPWRTLECYRTYNAQWAASPSYRFFDDRKLGVRTFQDANRAAIGQFIGAQGIDICLTNNTTMGLTMALLGLPLEKGDEILASEHEHWALIAALKLLQQRGVSVRYVPIPVPLENTRSVLDAFRSRMGKHTTAIAVSHVTWTTGARLPVQELCALARDRGIITILDGAHTLGAISLDVTKIGCDFYPCSGHKWLNGPPGTGALYIRDAASNPCKLQPILCEDIPNVRGEISTRLQIRGCNNTPGFAAMAESAAFAAELGRDIIEGRILALSAYLKGRVINEWGEAALYSPHPRSPALGSGLTTFLPSKDPRRASDENFLKAIVADLWSESRIYVRYVGFPILPAGVPPPTSAKRFAIRASTHIFNTFSEIDRLIDETCRIAGRYVRRNGRSR